MKRFLLLALCALFALNADARTLYVNAKRPNNSGNGLSKSKAKKTLQAAINVAKKGDTILVLPGTYAPIKTNNKKIAIKSVKGQNKTKLAPGKNDSVAADLAKHAKKNGGTYGFAYADAIGNATVLSGFLLDGTVRGDIWGGASAACGGTLKSCAARNFHFTGGFGKSKLENCLVQGNFLSTGSYFWKCMVKETRITKNGNGERSLPPSGFAIESTFVNCLVAGNTNHADWFLRNSTLLNCTIADNLFVNGTSAERSKFYNCILRDNCSQRRWWESKTVDKTGPHEEYGYFDPDGTWVRDEDGQDEGYEDESGNWIDYDHQSRTVTGPYTVEEYVERTDPKKLHNVDAGNTYKNTDKANKDPKFVNVAKGDYKLKKGSYCIDKGKLTAAQKKQVGTKDLAGKKRIKGKAIDRGCYEY